MSMQQEVRLLGDGRHLVTPDGYRIPVSLTGTIIIDSGTTFTGDIISTVNNTYDLGSTTNRWAEIWSVLLNSTNITTSGVFTTTGTFTGNLTPTTDSTYDIGTTLLRWDQVFADNYVVTNNITMDSGSRMTGDLIPSADNTYDLGALATRWAEGHIYALTAQDVNVNRITLGSNSTIVPSATSTVTGDWLPSTADTHDLGSAALPWQDLYVSGQIYIDGVALGTSLPYDLIPDTDATRKIGNTTNRWESLTLAYSPSGAASGINAVWIADTLPGSTPGDYSITIGSGAAATAEEGIAIGKGALASVALDNIAIGAGAAASAVGGDAVAFGKNTVASGAQSTAIGYGPTATGTSAMAYGQSADATGNFSMAFGMDSTASNGDAYAIGKNTVASGAQSLTIGYGSTAAGTSAISIGQSADAGGDNSISIGRDASSSHATSICLGYECVSAAASTFHVGSVGQPLATEATAGALVEYFVIYINGTKRKFAIFADA